VPNRDFHLGQLRRRSDACWCIRRSVRGAQLIHTDETLARGLSSEDVKERRRIEIRLRKSAPATEPSAAIAIPLQNRERPDGIDGGAPSSIQKPIRVTLPPQRALIKRKPQARLPVAHISEEPPPERSVPSQPASIPNRDFGRDPAGQ